MNAHHIYAHSPNQPPENGTWLISVPQGTLALWLPLLVDLAKRSGNQPLLISAVDAPPTWAYISPS